MAFFLIFSIVFGLLDQAQIIRQLNLIEIGLAPLKSQHSIYLRLLTRFGMLVFFTNLRFMEFQVIYLDLFCLFSVIGSFKWLQIGNLHKNIQLILEFRKAPLLSMLMILLSAQRVIRHLVCSNNYSCWLLNLNLIYKTLWTGAGSGLLISMFVKLNLFHLMAL